MSALEVGISHFDFWDMTFGEVIETIKAYQKRKKEELKERAMMDFKLSQCIGIQVACILSDKNKPREFMEIYDFLYSDEEKEEIVAKQQEEKEIQAMMNMANFYNSVRNNNKINS